MTELRLDNGINGTVVHTALGLLQTNLQVYCIRAKNMRCHHFVLLPELYIARNMTALSMPPIYTL